MAESPLPGRAGHGDKVSPAPPHPPFPMEPPVLFRAPRAMAGPRLRTAPDLLPKPIPGAPGCQLYGEPNRDEPFK